MTIVQGASFTGIDVNRIRPGVRDRQGDLFETVAADQACAYETITGIKVPGSSTIAATPHVHDGTSGPIIPIPLVSTYVGGVMYPSTSALVRGNAGWSPIVRAIQYTPTGVTRVRAWVTVATAASLQLLRATVFDSSITLTSIGDFVVVGVYDGLVVAYADMDTTDGALNLYQLEYRTASASQPLPSDGDRAYTFVVVPLAGDPISAAPYIDQGTTSTSVLVPSSTEFAPLSVGYHPMHDTAFDADKPISGFMVRGSAFNDGMLYELATGQPYSGRASTTWAGHCHGAATSVTTTSAHGAVMDQHLLSVNFGVRRTLTGTKTDYRYDDDEGEGGAVADIYGRVFCSQLTNASGTSYRTLGAYPFCMPASLAANIHTGAGLKLKWSALVHISTSRITSGTMRATISSDTLGASGTSSAITSSTDGLHIITQTIDYHGAADVGRTGERAYLLLDAKRDTNYVANTSPTFGILSACLYLEA